MAEGAHLLSRHRKSITQLTEKRKMLLTAFHFEKRLKESRSLVNLFKLHDSGCLLTSKGMMAFVGTLQKIKEVKGRLKIDQV
jgi:hypothetical protein